MQDQITFLKNELSYGKKDLPLRGLKFTVFTDDQITVIAVNKITAHCKSIGVT